MKQPLVTRPPLGGGRARTPQAEAKLPDGGGPTQRGLPLDEGIPGQSTFNKPVDDIRGQEPRDESMYRIDGPDSIPKDQSRPDTIEEEYVDAQPSYNEGVGQPSTAPKTKYPYRDRVPNTHNASAEFVAALWRLSEAPVRRFRASDGVRVAATAEAILSGLDGDYKTRAAACSATLKRAVIKQLRWIFSVDCGNGAKAVKIKAIRPRANVTAFDKMNLELACSCKAWQWLGPEYHAKSQKYLLGKPSGTATTPHIKDPDGTHKVCKHVAAALAVARGWTIPRAKKAGMSRRSCQLCVAEWAVHPSIQQDGYEVRWDEAPDSTPTIYIRAHGVPEFGPAEYQIRREGESWPKHWASTTDLAGLVAKLGLDIRWAKVPVVTKVWLSSPRGSLSPFM